MRRRDFISAVGAVAYFPLVARAAGNRPRLAYLSIDSAEFDAPNLRAFRDSLQSLGYAEGRSVDIDYRYSEGDINVLAKWAQELVELKPDVALANAVSPTRALKRVAPALPIVCPGFGDSFVPSLAASFAHPAGSVTGIATIVEGVFGKVTELAIDAIPRTTKIGFLANPTGASMPEDERQIRSAAQARGIDVQTENVQAPPDLSGAFERLSTGNVQSVIIPPNGLLNSQLKQILALASASRLPLFFSQRSGVEAGGLASYGIDPTENYRLAATYVVKILKGAAAGDLPIEFPTKLDLAVNLKTAKTLGLTLPSSLLDRADEVIE
jgi:putative tryptophan/tyrosine transport system substrate-binding protein